MSLIVFEVTCARVVWKTILVDILLCYKIKDKTVDVHHGRVICHPAFVQLVVDVPPTIGALSNPENITLYINGSL